MLRKKFIILLCCYNSLCLAANQAMAGTLSDVEIDRATIEIDRPIREIIEAQLSPAPRKVPEVEKEAPEPPAQGPSFHLIEIKMAGMVSLSEDILNPILAQYQGRDVSFSDLQTLTQTIDQAYLKSGFIATTFLPPQEIKDGIVTLQVIEAKMGQLRVQAHKHFRASRLHKYWQIQPGQVLNHTIMKYGLQLMNKNPDRQAKITLHSGETPGSTDVLLEVDAKFPVHTSFTLDREGSGLTGTHRFGFGMKHNNFLTQDDTFLAGVSIGHSFLGYYVFHLLPISYFGTTLFYGLSISHSEPQKFLSAFGLK